MAAHTAKAKLKQTICSRPIACLPLFLALAAPVVGHAAEATQNVLTFHADPTRAGNYVAPTLTWDRARAVKPDTNFKPQIPDHIYAQPLYWHDNNRALLIVATESDNVYAVDAKTGETVWKTALGKPVPLSAVACGDIDPLGVTGTPVIDPGTQSLYVGALVTDPSSDAPEQEIFAISLTDGSINPGWPVKVSKALNGQGPTFSPRTQNERGALAVLGDTVYVPYGSTWDCGSYRGWVVGVKLRDPSKITNWHTAALGGGVWSPGGIATDGRSLFVSTGTEHDPIVGNRSVGAAYSGTTWGNGQGVVRLDPGPSFSGSAQDFFTPKDWRTHDANDEDISGSAPVLFDLDDAKLAIQLSKDRNAYLLNRQDLGGFGGSLDAKQVTSLGPITTPSVSPRGHTAMVAFQGAGSDCPKTQGQPELTMLRVIAGEEPSIETAWCAPLSGQIPQRQLGAPMITTTDGLANPIVWILGAEDDNRLYGFQADTGERLFVSDALPGLHRFQSLIAVQNRLYIAADGNVFAFDF